MTCQHCRTPAVHIVLGRRRFRYSEPINLHADFMEIRWRWDAEPGGRADGDEPARPVLHAGVSTRFLSFSARVRSHTTDSDRMRIFEYENSTHNAVKDLHLQHSTRRTVWPLECFHRSHNAVSVWDRLGSIIALPQLPNQLIIVCNITRVRYLPTASVYTPVCHTQKWSHIFEHIRVCVCTSHLCGAVPCNLVGFFCLYLLSSGR